MHAAAFAAHIRAMSDPLLTLSRAAEYLSIPAPTLLTWRSRYPGRGPRAVKVGGLLRYRLSDLDAWVEAHLEPVRTRTPGHSSGGGSHPPPAEEG